MPDSSTPDQQALRAGGRSSISLMKSVPSPACSSRPGVRAVRAPRVRTAALSASASRRLLAISVHERRGGARAALVQVARERLAARAGLADQQHRRGVGGDLLQLGAQLLHDPALADRHQQRRAEQLARLAVAPAGIERALHRAQQLRERQRLLDEIEGAEARRLDRGLDRAVTGHHHHRAAVGGAGRPLAQQRDAVDVGHPDVEQHQVGRLPRARGARLGGVGGDIDLVAFLGEDLLQQAADVRLVIDHQNVWTRSCPSPSATARVVRARPLARPRAVLHRQHARARVRRLRAGCPHRCGRRAPRRSSSRSPAPGPCPWACSVT